MTSSLRSSPPLRSLISPAPLASLWHHEPSRLGRWFYLLLALVVTGWFFALNAAYFVPAHGGVDQNGYLVGGKMIADHGSMSLAPMNPYTKAEDPFQFVGRMWIGADLGSPSERFYPKYPIGLPLLFALSLRLFADPSWAFWISPICMTLGVLATFLLCREVLGSYLGLLATIAVATSPVTMQLANNPNSHASTFFCVTWGMYLLFAWWRYDGLWRALLGAFLVGYAVTIRYTEGLLLLPLLAIVLFHARAFSRRLVGGFLEALAVLSAWAIPVVGLVAYNYFAFLHLTGYDPTNESTGFAWEYFRENWDTMLRHLSNLGLFFFFPLAIAGLMVMCFRRKRLALVMAGWIIPNTLLYTAYYWAPDNNNIGYLRFFLTQIPALAICAFVLLEELATPHQAGAAGLSKREPGAAAQATAGASFADSAPFAPAATNSADDVQRERPVEAPDAYDLAAPDSPAPGATAASSATAARPQRREPAATAPPPPASRHLPAPFSLAAAVLVTLAVLVNLRNSIPSLQREQVGNLALRDATLQLMAQVPPTSIVFGREQGLLHYLQFMGDYRLYTDEPFNHGYIQRLGNVDPDQPQGLQPQRAQILHSRLKDRDQKALTLEQQNLVRTALEHGDRVFFVLPANMVRTNRKPPAPPAPKGPPPNPDRVTGGDLNALLRNLNRVAPKGLRETEKPKPPEPQPVEKFEDLIAQRNLVEIPNFPVPAMFQTRIICSWGSGMIEPPDLPVPGRPAFRKQGRGRQDPRPQIWRVVEVTCKDIVPATQPATTEIAAATPTPGSIPGTIPTPGTTPGPGADRKP